MIAALPTNAAASSSRSRGARKYSVSRRTHPRTSTVPHASLQTIELTRIRLGLKRVAMEAAADHSHDLDIRQTRSPVSATIRESARALSTRATSRPSRPDTIEPRAIIEGKSGGKVVSGSACPPVKSTDGGSLYEGEGGVPP